MAEIIIPLGVENLNGHFMCKYLFYMVTCLHAVVPAFRPCFAKALREGKHAGMEWPKLSYPAYRQAGVGCRGS